MLHFGIEFEADQFKKLLLRSSKWNSGQRIQYGYNYKIRIFLETYLKTILLCCHGMWRFARAVADPYEMPKPPLAELFNAKKSSHQLRGMVNC